MIRSFDIARPALPRAGRSLLADVNGANVGAGLTAGLFYAFGALPMQQNAIAGLNLAPGAATSWFFITFITSAVASIVLSLRFRQPLPIGWTMPGLIFLVSAGHRYGHAELAGASMAAGLMILVLGLLGIGERMSRWLPLPIVMGMFGGSILGFATEVFARFEAQPSVVGAALLGYLGAYAARRSWLPPVAGAFVTGLIASVAGGHVQSASFQWGLPLAIPVRPAFDVGGIFALSLPLVVLALGIGNAQGIGLLRGQGFRPPIKAITVTLGLATVINAAFGGHASSIQGNGVAMLGGADAGPHDKRYVANLVAATAALVLALGASVVGTLLGILPASLVPTLAGLALVGVLMDAFRKAALADLPMGAFFALVIAASPLTLLGIGSALWAMIGGLLVSLALERPALLRAWRGAQAAGDA